ncbi:flagellar basal body-associated FliL family protein [Isachenkonia alkalipeptolytica]|nr:flagellar basal body-associated FliL family protein [Isachenkonia alkalipeptolytica]
MEKENLKFLKKWLKHEYAPMVVAGAAILGVLVAVYLFFAHEGGPEASVEGQTHGSAYSENIKISSSGPAGRGRVKMSYYLRSEEAFEEAMATKEYVIRDLTIETLLSWDEESLSTREGMENFKEELLNLIYAETGIPVDGIYFHEFILN